MSIQSEGQDEVDLDGSSFAPPAKRHRALKGSRSRDWQPLGPVAFADVMSSNKHNVASVLAASCCGHTALANNIRDAVIVDKVFTSAYTGSGCFDASARESLYWMAELTQAVPGEIVCYAATEIQEFARKALMKAVHAPLHQFQDVLGRLPLDLRKKLKNVESAKLLQFKHIRIELRFGQMSTDEFFVEKTKLGKALFDEIEHNIHGIEFRTHDECTVSVR